MRLLADNYRARQNHPAFMTEPVATCSDPNRTFETAFEQAPIGMAHVGLDGSILRVNQYLTDFFRCSPENFERVLSEQLGPDGLRIDAESEGRLLRDERKSYSLTRLFTRDDGERVWIRLTVSVVRDENGEPWYFLSIVEDVTARRAAESQLREALDMLERRVLERSVTLSSTTERLRYLDARQRAMLNALPDLIFLNTREGEYVDYHASNPELLIVPAREFLGLKIVDVLPTALASSLMECFGETLRTGEPATVEYPLRLHNEDRFFEARVVACDDDKILTIVRDITDRKQAEESVRASLREKEVLLKEIHHRVKNNLQIITSLHRLQIRQTTNDEVRQLLLESESRVRTMALIHENLYQSKDLELVELSHYVNNLVRMIFRSFGEPARKVKLVQEIDGYRVDFDTAIPIGLIVNELVSNALKYAFAGKSDGVIAVRFGKCDGGRWKLEVSDDGPGLPADIDTLKARSLGLRLVRILAKQLGGDLSVSSDGGARFELVFPSKGSSLKPE